MKVSGVKRRGLSSGYLWQWWGKNRWRKDFEYGARGQRKWWDFEDEVEEEVVSIKCFIITLWTEFLNLCAVDSLGWIILCGGNCPLGCPIGGLGASHWLACSTPTPSCDGQKCLQTLPSVPWEPDTPLPGENHRYKHTFSTSFWRIYWASLI